jgi:hypothetical protein
VNATPEQWRPVVGFEGRYEVSNLGRVRSLDRPVEASWRGVPYIKHVKGRVLKPSLSANGYPHVVLEGKADRHVHVMVLESFVGPRPEEMEALHRDDIKTNNTIANLYWGTKSDNAHDKIRNGNHNHARKTRCIYGHPLSGDNLRITKRGHRDCRECQRRRMAEWKRKNAA